ncbi:hypothetical protein N408_00985 [Helicobacter pylori FD703]|nr:hypothetical protein N408_00985 [Helicobacter pylori FD703]
MGIETKSIKSRVWIYSHVDNKNTQRHFKINIKELTQDHTSGNFLKRFLGGLMGSKGGCCFKISLSALKIPQNKN